MFHVSKPKETQEYKWKRTFSRILARAFRKEELDLKPEISVNGDNVVIDIVSSTETVASLSVMMQGAECVKKLMPVLNKRAVPANFSGEFMFGMTLYMIMAHG